MTVVLRRRVLVAVAALSRLSLRGPRRERSSRHMTMRDARSTSDVRAPNVDTEWYASVLRAAAHGDEISAVTHQDRPRAADPALLLGEDAAALATRPGSFAPPTIILPAGRAGCSSRRSCTNTAITSIRTGT